MYVIPLLIKSPLTTASLWDKDEAAVNIFYETELSPDRYILVLN